MITDNDQPLPSRCLVLLSLGLLVGAPLPAAADTGPQVQTLHEETFDDGRAVGWKYYDSSLHFRDALVSGETDHRGDGSALLGEGNASSQSLSKRLRQTSLSFPIRDDVYINFAYCCQAERNDGDEITIDLEGHGPDGNEPFAVSIPVALNPAVRTWHVVTVPLSACGPSLLGGALDERLTVRWSRGAHDAHTLVLDDFSVTRGTELEPLLIAPGSLQAIPHSIVVHEGRYVDTLRIRAGLFGNQAWKLTLAREGEGGLRTFSGTGDKVDVAWDGREESGQAVRPGKVTASLEVMAPVSAGRSSTRSVTATVVGGPFRNVLAPPHALLAAGETIDYAARTAVDNIVTPGDVPAFSPAAGPVELTIEQGRRAGRRLKLVALQGTLKGVPILAGPLSDGRGNTVSGSNVILSEIERVPLDFGYFWRDTRIVDAPPAEDADVLELELAVAAPADLPVGTYRAAVKVGLGEFGLRVNVTEATSAARWWHDRKIRLMLAKPQVMPRQEYFLDSDKGYRDIAQAGFNAMIPYVGVDSHALCGNHARRFGLKLIARTPVPSYPDQDHEPLFVWPTGLKPPLSCPYSDRFWTTRVLPHAEKLAATSLHVPLVGLEYDFEMYWKHEQKYSHIYTHCYCDTCWREFSNQAAGELPALAAAQRSSWLVSNRRLAEYKLFQDTRLRAQVRKLKRLLHGINRELQVMILAWGNGHFMEIVAAELGTPQTPVILSTEVTYGRGRTPLDTPRALARDRLTCINGLRQMRRLGIRGLYVPGVMPGHQKADPDFCGEKAITLSRFADGYWVFFQQVEPGTTVTDYMAQFTQANAEISAWNGADASQRTTRD